MNYLFPPQCWFSYLLLFVASTLSGVSNASESTTYERTVYYVATNGSDTDVGNKSEPFRTIQHAVNRAESGDTIYVREGTYHESIRMTKSGTAQAPIQLLAFPGELPIIDGQYSLPTGEPTACSNVAPYHCFIYNPLVLIQGSHIEFSGFAITRSRGRGLGVASAPDQVSMNVLINACQISNTRNAGINIQDAEDITIQNCDISYGANFATHERSSSELNWPVIVNVIRSHNVTVRRSKIHENWGEGIAAGRDSSNVVIEDNIIYDNHALQIYLHRSQDVLVQRNLVYHTNTSTHLRSGNPSDCIVVNNESNFMDSLVTTRIEIINNVVTGCGRGIAIWSNANTNVQTSHVRIAHNVVANSTRNDEKDPIGIFVNPKVPLHDITIEKNIILQDRGLVDSIPVDPQINTSTNLWSSVPSLGASNSSDYIGDPLLQAPRQTLSPGTVQVEWFKPQRDSPAIQFGMGPYEYLDQRQIDISVHPSTPESTDKNSTPVPTQENPSTTTIQPQILFNFDENDGKIIYDRSRNQQQIDLKIDEMSAVRWTKDGLTVIEPTIIKSSLPATKIIDSCRSSNSLSLALWITPAAVEQSGPARIVSLSKDTTQRNFTVGQGQWGDRSSDVFNFRLRTVQTDPNGEPSLNSSTGVVKAEKTHLVYTRNSSDLAEVYINGKLSASGVVPGKFDNWDVTYTLVLANEVTGNRPWLGTYHQIAIYCQELTASDVREIYRSAMSPPGFTSDERENMPEHGVDSLETLFLPMIR